MTFSWQADLDPQQWEAVSCGEGPTLVLAGAGSGKTRVLTYRIAYLLEQGMAPEAILALTFTNKAADTMRERLQALVGDRALNLTMGTFHSVFARWLRRELRGNPVSSDFTIYDEEDSLAVLKTLLKEHGQEAKQASAFRRTISRWKNAGLGWQQVKPTNPHEIKAVEYFRLYEQRLRAANALDFDDLLLQTEQLFLREPEVLARYQTRYLYILVDEYQDTNPLQYRVLRLLAARHRNLFVVGDDAQSIYSFRGADVHNFHRLKNDFAPVRLIRLEQNYRSTPQILEVANALLEHSEEVHPKRLFTRNPVGPPPHLYTACRHVREEASFVAQKIREECARHHLRYGDFAVLYRTHAYSRSFEEAFRLLGIPYRVVGSLSFYRREEVKHFTAFLRFLVNPDDDAALLRIAGVLAEGVGDITWAKLQEQAQVEGCSLWGVLPQGAALLRGPVQRALESFYKRLQAFRERVGPLPFPYQVEEALEQSGLLSYYDQDERAAERKENLHELVAAAQEYARQHGEQASLRGFLESVALASSAEDPEKGPQDRVWLSTVHAVKGLEFHTVFLVGVIEGYFPHSYAQDEGPQALEEERRIFYVALTRARRHLYISAPQYDPRSVREPRPAIPSRFLREIGLLEAPKGSLGVRLTRPAALPTPSPEKAAGFLPSDPAQIKPGMTIEHLHFGRGVVLAREENGALGVVQVQFEKSGIKKLDLRYAKLRLVS